MTAQEYLRSLTFDQDISTIPVQVSELKFLLALLISEQGLK